MSNPYRQSYKQEITDNVSLAVFNCGLQSCAPNHSWGPGVRDHFLIHFVLSGKGKYVCDEWIKRKSQQREYNYKKEPNGNSGAKKYYSQKF